MARIVYILKLVLMVDYQLVAWVIRMVVLDGMQPILAVEEVDHLPIL